MQESKRNRMTSTERILPTPLSPLFLQANILFSSLYAMGCRANI